MTVVRNIWHSHAKMHLHSQRLRTFPKHALGFSTVNLKDLTHFSLRLNVAVCVRGGNMQVQGSPVHQTFSPAARRWRWRWWNTTGQDCIGRWTGTLWGWTGSSKEWRGIWPPAPWALTCKEGRPSAPWRRNSSPLDRRSAAALPSPPIACGTRAGGPPWTRGGCSRGTGGRGSGSLWESPRGGGASPSGECCEGTPPWCHGQHQGSYLGFGKDKNTDGVKIHLDSNADSHWRQGRKNQDRVNQDEQTRAINTCVPGLLRQYLPVTFSFLSAC